MKSRKTLSLLSAILILSLLLCGCGSSAKSESYADVSAPAAAGASYYSVEKPEEWDDDSYNGIAPDGGANQSTAASTAAQLQSEKIIYSANADIETIDYETAVQGVYDLVERYGGFVQSASISGSNYYRASRGIRSLRTASFTLRIPSEHFTELTNSLSELGNVPYCNTNSENITAQYYDTQSRMEAYKVQEERLMEMLAIAETVDDMLAIQQQLTEVQYEIDSLQSRLTNYDRRVNYSTVTLTVREVEEYTETPEVVLTYWEKMGKGFARSLQSVGEFFTEGFLWLVSNLPVLALWAVGLFLGGKLFSRWRRKRAEKKSGAPRLSWKEKRAAKKSAKDGVVGVIPGSEEK